MNIKKIQLTVFKETMQNLTKGIIKSIEGDYQNIHVTITIRMDKFLIIFFDKNKKNDSDRIILNRQVEFSDAHELLNVIELPKDDICYLLKINMLPDLLKENYNNNRNLNQQLVSLNNYNPYLDVLYTNFLNNTEFAELCLRIINMDKIDENWKELFKSKCDYAGYEVKMKKYNMDLIKDLDTNTIEEITYKLFVIASIFLKRNKEEMRDDVFKQLNGIAIRTYNLYTTYIDELENNDLQNSLLDGIL